MSLLDFFHRYAEISMGPRPEDLAPLYAPTFIVGGPQGSQAFANDARFLDWLRQVGDFNRQHGMRRMKVVSLQDSALSPIHAIATVRWGAMFDKAGDSWKILSYLSKSDQEEEMKKEGLL